VSEVLPTRSKSATLLLAGESGCTFRSLTPPPVGTMFRSQDPCWQEDGCALAASLSGELGCDFRHLCSPHSVP
jgi:hypothetical protein